MADFLIGFVAGLSSGWLFVLVVTALSADRDGE